MIGRHLDLAPVWHPGPDDPCTAEAGLQYLGGDISTVVVDGDEGFGGNQRAAYRFIDGSDSALPVSDQVGLLSISGMDQFQAQRLAALGDVGLRKVEREIGAI